MDFFRGVPFWVFLSLLVHGSFVCAKDLGIHGHTYPIQEPDLLKHIEGKLRFLKEEGSFEKHNQILLKKAENSIHTPSPVKGMTKTVESREFYYDPSITVPYDLKDHEGRIFHKAGTKINPLTIHSLPSILVFMDGEDEGQVSWLEKNYLKRKESFKIILTSGSPFALMEKWQRPVYFDQEGRLTHKLGIHHIPAVVSQEGLRLKISEVSLNKEAL